MKNVAKVEFWWDDVDPSNKGWYAVAKNNEGDAVSDSMKIWFPVDVNQFDEDEEAELGAALKAAFPGADVEPSY